MIEDESQESTEDLPFDNPQEQETPTQPEPDPDDPDTITDAILGEMESSGVFTDEEMKSIRLRMQKQKKEEDILGEAAEVLV